MSHRGRDRMVDGTRISSGAHLKKLRRADGGAKNVGVFRVKNHVLRQKIIRRPWELPMQSVPITPKSFRLNSDQAKCTLYNLM